MSGLRLQREWEAEEGAKVHPRIPTRIGATTHLFVAPCSQPVWRQAGLRNCVQAPPHTTAQDSLVAQDAPEEDTTAAKQPQADLDMREKVQEGSCGHDLT